MSALRRPRARGSRISIRTPRLPVLWIAVQLVLGVSTSTAERPLAGTDWIPPGHVEPLSFGMLLTGEAAVGADPANRRDDGFSVADSRLLVRGALEGGFGYLVQGNFQSTPSLLDLEIQWEQPDVGFRIKTGFFRVPFSGELQIGAPDLDLIDRSQIVTAVSPDRQVGVEIDQEIADEALVVRIGAFNGNGFNDNDDNRLLYTLRFEGKVLLSEGAKPDSVEESGWRLDYGVSGAYSKDRDARLGLDLPRNFQGTRVLGGADIRLSKGPVFVSGEGLYASIDPRALSRRDIYGGQATIGWHVLSWVQLLARYDAFRGGSLASDLDLAIASVNLDLTAYISFQTELRVPTLGADPTPGGIVNLNVTF